MTNFAQLQPPCGACSHLQIKRAATRNGGGAFVAGCFTGGLAGLAGGLSSLKNGSSCSYLLTQLCNPTANGKKMDTSVLSLHPANVVLYSVPPPTAVPNSLAPSHQVTKSVLLPTSFSGQTVTRFGHRHPIPTLRFLGAMTWGSGDLKTSTFLHCTGSESWIFAWRPSFFRFHVCSTTGPCPVRNTHTWSMLVAKFGKPVGVLLCRALCPVA